MVEGLGVAEAAKFLQQLEPGSGNYTEERHKWLDDITIDEVVDSIEQHKALVH
ncbi:MAG: hypothetical protein IJR87_11240 [Bacteroidaceae bacterium]|nr:hypothetical protein [Bacteroidaceae bacterium]